VAYSSRVNVDWFNISLTEFARSVGAGQEKIIVLVMDRAGCKKREKVVIPEGIYLEPLPPYSPEFTTSRAIMDPC
jgi:transposase